MQAHPADQPIMLVAPPAPPAPNVMTHLERLLTIQEVSRLSTLSRHKIYRLIRAGRFPRPLALSDQRVAWRSTAIAAWMAALPEVRFGAGKSKRP